MNFNDTLEDCLMMCPAIFPNALTVYDHLFLVCGNGYEWNDGELVSRDEYSLGRKHTTQEAIEKQIRFYFLDNMSNYVGNIVERIELGVDFAEKMHKHCCEQVIGYINDIFDVENRKKDFSFESADKAFCRVCGFKYKLYGLSDYSKLASLPDDITNDWLAAAEKMYEILDGLVESNSNRVEGSMWLKLSTIKKRIDELKAKRNTNTQIEKMTMEIKVPTYNEETIREAIEKEGLCADAWGYKTKGCIFVFEDGMENNEVWDKVTTPLRGFEQAHYNRNILEPVRYFIISKSEYDSYAEGYEGNVDELADYVDASD